MVQSRNDNQEPEEDKKNKGSPPKTVDKRPPPAIRDERRPKTADKRSLPVINDKEQPALVDKKLPPATKDKKWLVSTIKNNKAPLPDTIRDDGGQRADVTRYDKSLP